jgi:hypothetical protein
MAAVVGETAKAVGRMRMPPVLRRELTEIRKGLAAWRSTLAKSLLSYCDDEGGDGDFEAGSGDCLADSIPCDDVDGLAETAAATMPSSTPVDDNDAAEAEFKMLVHRMNALLAPLLTDPALNFAFGAGVDADGEEIPGAGNCAAGKAVMILADRILGDLPLEALGMFDNAKSLARDFSLHMLYHRVTEGADVDPDTGARTPRDNVHAVSDAGMGMIVDPRSEDASPGEDSAHPRPTIAETWAGSAKVVGKWAGIVGPTDHIASGQEWQTILQTRGGGGMVYYGMGRALSYCPPALVAGLTLSGCKLLVLIDRAENDASNRRQSKLDNQKTAAQLALEQPFQTAALFSLAGVNTVMMNQWSNTLHANGRLVSEWLPLLKESKELNLASALQQIIRPAKRDPPAPESAGRPDSKSGKGKGKGKKKVASAEEPVRMPKNRVKFNTVVYGVPHVIFDK